MKQKGARSKLLSPKAQIPKVTKRFLRCLYYINLPHFHFTGWSSWSRCSNQCGKGHRIRRWECNDDSSGNHCNNSLLAREKEGCNSAELCDIGKDRVWLSFLFFLFSRYFSRTMIVTLEDQTVCTSIKKNQFPFIETIKKSFFAVSVRKTQSRFDKNAVFLQFRSIFTH